MKIVYKLYEWIDYVSFPSLLSYFAGCATQRLIKTIDHKLNTDLEGLIWDLEAIQWKKIINFTHIRRPHTGRRA